MVVPLWKIPGYVDVAKGIKQKWCVVCKARGEDRKATTACLCCSQMPYLMVVHDNCNGYTCLTQHRRNPGKHERSLVKGKRARDDDDE